MTAQPDIIWNEQCLGIRIENNFIPVGMEQFHAAPTSQWNVIPALMQKTGLSRGFFYKNPIVRGEVDAAMEQQAGMVDPRRNIISQAMETEMYLLQQQIQKLKSENENLKKENQKLKKALSKRELNLIKQL